MKKDINVQSFFKKLTEELEESPSSRVMFTIDDEQVDSLFSKQFDGEVDYEYDGPDAYYITSQIDLEKFVDYVESMGLDSNSIQIHQYFNENMTGGGEAYLPAMNVPSKKQNPFKETSELYESIKENFSEDVLSGYTQNKNFRPGHTPDTGGFQYKDLWGVNEAQKKSKTNAEELARVEDYLKVATSSQKSSAEDRIKKLKILVGIEKRTNQKLPLLTYGTFWVDYLKKQGVKDSKELEAKYSKSKTDENKLAVIKEINQIVDEVFSPEDYRKVLQVIEKIKYTNTALYNAILDMITDVYPHDYGEVEAQMQMNENYARFRNETKTRTKPEQFHEAVKSVKRKVQEINKLYEYMERLKMELSESSDGLKYKKYTENAIIKIKEAVKALHLKTKKLK